MKQTRAASLTEALTRVVFGYCTSIAITAYLLPWAFEIYIPFNKNLKIGIVFACASIALSFALRRLFEAMRVHGILR